MRALLNLILLASSLYQALTMTCATVTNQTKCGQLTGCTWASSCSGDYVPTCAPPSCYYVDIYATTSNETGTVDNPTKTISTAVNKFTANNSSGTIYILNYVDNVTAEVTQAHVVSSNITITPLFPNATWSLDFSRAPVTATISFFRLNTDSSLTVRDAIVTFAFSATVTQYMFESYGGTVNLTRVHFLNVTGSRGFVYRTTSYYRTANFNYKSGIVLNGAPKFTMAGNNSYMYDIKFINLSSTTPVLALSNTGVFDRIYATGGTISLFSTTQGAIMTMTHSRMEHGSITVITTAGSKQVTFLDCTFYNLTGFQTTPQFAIKDVSSDSLANVFEDCKFINITVLSSLFITEKNGVALNFNRCEMTNIRKSTLTEDPALAAEWVGGLCLLSRNDAVLSFTNTNFTNIYSHCLGVKASSLSMINCRMNNTLLDVTRSTLTTSMGNTLNEKSGISWVIIEDTTKIITTGYQVVLKNNHFGNSALIPKYGGAIRFSGIVSSQIYAVENEFIDNIAYYGGSIYVTNVLTALNFTNNVFTNSAAYDGGAIYKKSIEFTGKIYVPSVYMKGDKFYNCSAIRNGGALLLDWDSICMENVEFRKSSAQNGGGIYLVNLDRHYNDIYGCMKNVQFISNSAVDVGGAMKLFFSSSFLRQDSSAPMVFTGNTAYKDADISSEKPSYYRFSFYNVLVEKTFSEFDDLSEWVHNTTRTKFAFSINTSETTSSASARLLTTSNTRQITQKSGHEINQIMVLEIMNDEGGVINFIRNEQVSVEIVSYNNTINSFEPFVAASPVIFTFKDGTIYAKNTLQMIGEPKTTATLNFKGIRSTSNLLRDANILIDFNISVYFKDCEVGDVFNTLTRTCDTCAAGTYSLSDPYNGASCLECDVEKADCLGGSKIAVKPNFWRYDAFSSTILECPADGSCLGGLVNETYFDQGVCGDEYQGNLCNQCISNFAKFGASDSCMDCKRDGGYYVKFVGFFALRVIAVVYSVKVNLNKISTSKKARSSSSNELRKKLKNEDFQSNLIKIVVNFLQVSSLIVQYRFEWPDFILDVVEITNKFIPTEKDGFSVDCIVALITQDNSYVYFIKLVVTLFQPFGLWLGLILGYMLILKIKKEPVKGNPKLTKNIVVLFVITAFVIQPSIVQATLEVFKCQNLKDSGNPTYYMVKDSEIECWTSFHIMWSVGIALPFFLLWGVVLPLVLLKKLKTTSKNLETPEVYARFAFIYVGLKNNRYYWEFILLLRKTLIIIVFVFLNMISIQTQAFATFLIILGFGVGHVKFQPYVDKRLNRLEMLSTITLGIMIYSGMFFLSGGSTDFTTILLIVISLIFNFSFYLLTAFYFIRSYRHAAKRLTRSVTTRIKGSLDKAKNRNSSGSDSSMSSDRKNSIDNGDKIEEMLSDVNLQLQNIEENKEQAQSDASQIPSEGEGESERDGKKTVYADRKEEASNYSIMKNSGYYNPPITDKQSGFQSFHNSTVGLLSPAGHRQFSFLNADRFLRPLSMDQSGQEDTPRVRAALRMEDSPKLKLPRGLQNMKVDESLLLRQMPSQSEPRKSQDEVDENNDNNEHNENNENNEHNENNRGDEEK